MGRTLLVLTAISLVGGVAAYSYQRDSAPGFVFKTEDVNPVSRLDFPDAKSEFSFAIVSDRTGSHRPNVFAQAVEKLNLMQPQFVVSVGDLIEGGGTDKFTLNEWKEVDSYVNKLTMPFFYLVGNHDRKQGAGQRVWDAKLGRSHYSFVYRDALFLMLCTEDLPGKIGKEQVQWVRKTLADNAKVRWTFVFLHRPLWDEIGAQVSGFPDVEQALAGRKYTVFCGHIHSFQKYVRQGMNYYQLATTGGGSWMRGVRFGEFDHFTWVTMKDAGPVIGHVLLSSVHTENLAPIKTFEPGVEW
jgi:serine/threonine-protein phosphatase CPPED1